MAQQPIEIILLKQWASYMAVPIWISDAEGDLIYYNERAEPLLGRRFDETGAIPAEKIAELFVTTGIDGNPIPNEELPLVIALTKRVPAHLELRFRGLDGLWHDVAVTALPLEGQADRFLGAVAVFWERPEE